MANVLFTNVRILDGSGSPPYDGRVAKESEFADRARRLSVA